MDTFTAIGLMHAPNAVPTLLIVIVNYRTADLVIDCLRSLAPEVTGPSPSPSAMARVVVVDNASGDGSAEVIAGAMADNGWSSWAEVLALTENRGFAAGNNAAITPAMASNAPPRYVWLLNPDTVVRPGAMASLVAFLESHPEVGIAGSRLESPDGTVQRSAFRFPSVLGELENGLRLGLASKLLARWIVAPPVSASACPTDWVSGASLMVRREVLQTIGPLDDDYFMYFEEVDFCRRAAAAGWPSWYVPSASVVHLAGQSTGVDDPRVPRKRRPRYWFDARRRYFLIHLGPLQTRLADLCWAAGFATFRLRRLLQGKPDTDPDRLLVDFLRYNLLDRSGRREPATSSAGAVVASCGSTAGVSRP